jgi:hypothetical protein
MNIWRHSVHALLGLICLIGAAILVSGFRYFLDDLPWNSPDMVRRIIGVAGVGGILLFSGMSMLLADWREWSQRRRNSRGP